MVLLIGLLLATTPTDRITVSVDATAPIFEVSPAFVSHTIDAASLCDDAWPFPAAIDSVTIARARLLSKPGLVIRFGGTSADNEQFVEAGVPLLPRLPTVVHGSLGNAGCNLTAMKWQQLAAFAAKVNASLVYGVNSLLRVGAKSEGPIDLRNADKLLQFAASDAPSPAVLLGFEVGNEPLAWTTQHYTNLTPAEHAADFGAMRNSLAKTFKKANRPLILGPDVFGLTKRGGAATAYLSAFLAAKPDLDIVTTHLYPLMSGRNITAQQFANETLLDISRRSASAARAIVDASLGPQTPLWVGEGSPSWQLICDHGCGKLGSNLTFELAYLDMLGSFAASGVELFARQCLNSVINPGGVTPGYWTGILFKMLMGSSVLNVSTPAECGVRGYAHAKLHSITLMLLNLRAEAVEVTPAFGHAPSCATSETARRWTLEAGPQTTSSASVLLNGAPLAFADKNSAVLPSMPGRASGCAVLELPPQSATWLVLGP